MMNANDALPHEIYKANEALQFRFPHRFTHSFGDQLNQCFKVYCSYLFAMIMDVVARGINDISPWCMLYADNIVLCGTRSEVVEEKLEEWRRAMEDRGLKINRKKTVYLRFNVDRDMDDGNSDVNIQGENLE